MASADFPIVHQIVALEPTGAGGWLQATLDCGHRLTRRAPLELGQRIACAECFETYAQGQDQRN